MGSNEDQFISVSDFSSFASELLIRLAKLEDGVHTLKCQQVTIIDSVENSSGQKGADNVSSPNVSVIHQNTPADSSMKAAYDDKKSKALTYHAQEMERNKKWMSSGVDEFTKELKDELKFVKAFATYLPAFSGLMDLFRANRDHVLSVLECTNFKVIEKNIYLPPLDPKEKHGAARPKRVTPRDRRQWLALLRVICFPFFNENRPKNTGNSRLDYTDRVYLVAQWIKTHLFLDKRQFMHLVTGPSGMLTKEYKMIITTEVIVNDIRSVQKNRGDSDTRHFDRLIELDKELEIEVPKEVVQSLRKRSPSKKGMFDEEEMGVEDGLEVESSGDDEVKASVDVSDMSGGEASDVTVVGAMMAGTGDDQPTNKKARTSGGDKKNNKPVVLKTTSTPNTNPVVSRELARRPLGAGKVTTLQVSDTNSSGDAGSPNTITTSSSPPPITI